MEEGYGQARVAKERQSPAGDKHYLRVTPAWVALSDNEGQFPCVGTGVTSSSQELYGLLHIRRGALRSPSPELPL